MSVDVVIYTACSRLSSPHHSPSPQVQERAQRLEVQLHKARAEAVKREAELIDQRDARGEPETFQELKKFVQSYNTVRASLDKCLASLEVIPPAHAYP